ncbi:polysaccharide ABC transporter ATP-binding protein [Lutibacter sp.]|uniref:ABC transporter ATP-binding protein n=1 Tax=Lutibacter sp. TaxID=1925666 RepID=UPI001A27BCFB|nr:polysaccharide ABC transporter ATP-binding protein [Lutibacter sp.]MBI9042006.1 ATP-binding cassette domain-containing protein [Lutibacter sp.]
MSKVILKIENLSKQYRLGLVGTGTLGDDLKRWWANIRGKEDPFLKIGDVNDRSTKGSSDYVWALKDINFEVQQGEVLGIIGKNGAGKSTLLKILSKITSPTTGSIKSKGRVASLLEVGTGFHGEMTGRENIFLNGAILGMTKKEINGKLDEIIEFSGCERYIDTPVKRYSSGMTVRLAFAVAAFLEPDILIIDEVLAVGDAEFQKKAIGKMQEISKGAGRTVLFVSHNMAAVQSLCTRGILLENGMISFSGTTEDTIAKYLTGNKETVSDFSEFKDRSGKGNIIFTKIILGNPQNPTSVFKLGENIGFHFDFVVNNKIDTNKLRILIGVYNEREEGILRFDSDANANLAMNNNLINGKISCIMEDHLTIMPGKYSVNFALFNDGIMEDYIAGKVLFDVVNDNYLGGSKTLDNNSLAKVLYRHKWTLNKISN